jgi:superoxide dismutase, Fe-Mn family
MPVMEKAHALNLNPILPLKIPRLPFDPDNFGDAISARTFELHHGKHHSAYAKKTNELALHAQFTATYLEDVIAASEIDPDHQSLHENALQFWNHSFQWSSLSENGNPEPAGHLMKHIQRQYGSFEAFATEAVEAGTAHFGSGWLWFAHQGRSLDLLTTHDAGRPINPDDALLVVDLWEHAYYLDHQNKREDYLDKVIRNHWNWSFAEVRYAHTSSLYGTSPAQAR